MLCLCLKVFFYFISRCDENKKLLNQQISSTPNLQRSCAHKDENKRNSHHRYHRSTITNSATLKLSASKSNNNNRKQKCFNYRSTITTTDMCYFRQTSSESKLHHTCEKETVLLPQSCIVNVTSHCNLLKFLVAVR